MNAEDRKTLNTALLKNHRKLHHVIADGLGALMDQIEEMAPQTAGDRAILDLQMNAISLATLAVAVLMYTRGGTPEQLDQIADYISSSQRDLQAALRSVVTMSKEQFTAVLPENEQVPVGKRPQNSTQLPQQHTVVIGKQDEEGNMLPMSDQLS